MRIVQGKPLDFSGYLKHLLEDEWHMKVAVLAKKLKQSSKTTIYRILQGTARPETEAEFLERMKACEELPLSEEQLKGLNEALEVSRVGVEQYMKNCAIASLVTEPQPDGGPVHIDFFLTDGGVMQCDMASMADHLLEHGGTLHIWATGYINPCMMVRLHQDVIERYPGRVTVEHYLCCSGTSTIHAMASVMPVLYDKDYRMYIVSTGSISVELASFYRTSSAVLEVEEERGNHYYSMFITDRNKASLVEYASVHTFQSRLSVFKSAQSLFRPVKIDQPLTGESDDYLHYTEWYCEMEKDAPAYIVRADVPIMFIHPDILVPACTDGFQSAGFCPEEKLTEEVQRYYGVQLARWENFFAGNKLTHVIFSWKPMVHFARTGATSDQFFAIRPFTPLERLAILENLRAQLDIRNRFFIYFLKPSEPPIRDEISFYEGKGVYFCQGSTDYNLSRHSEALIVEEEFCSCYREYFLGQLLRKHVTSSEMTRQLMNDLISIVRSQL